MACYDEPRPVADELIGALTDFVAGLAAGEVRGRVSAAPVTPNLIHWPDDEDNGDAV